MRVFLHIRVQSKNKQYQKVSFYENRQFIDRTHIPKNTSMQNSDFWYCKI